MIDKLKRSIFIADIRNFFDNKEDTSIFDKYVNFKSKDKALKQSVEKFTTDLITYFEDIFDYDEKVEENLDYYNEYGYYAKEAQFDDSFIKWCNRMLLLLESEAEMIGIRSSKIVYWILLYFITLFGMPFLLCEFGIISINIYWTCYFIFNTLVITKFCFYLKFCFRRRQKPCVAPFDKFEELSFARRTFDYFEKIEFNKKQLIPACINEKKEKSKNYHFILKSIFWILILAVACVIITLLPLILALCLGDTDNNIKLPNKKLTSVILGLLICGVLSGCVSNQKANMNLIPSAENEVVKPKRKYKPRPIEEVKETFDGRLYRIYNAPPIEYQGD